MNKNVKRALIITSIVLAVFIFSVAVYIGLFGIITWKGDQRIIVFKGLFTEENYTEMRFSPETDISAENTEKAVSIIEQRIKECDISIGKIKIDDKDIIIRYYDDSEIPKAELEKTIIEMCWKGEVVFCTGASYNIDNIIMDNSNIKSAEAKYDQDNGFSVFIQLDSEGTEIFADVTETLKDSMGQISICVDETVIVAPTVQSAITDGQVVITGLIDMIEAKSLAAMINFEPLPVGYDIK